MKSWIGAHFDVIAAAWLIVLVFAWSIALAAAAGSRPADWSGPLIGGVDWYSTVAANTPTASPAPSIQVASDQR